MSKYYKTTFTVTVLSEGNPVNPNADIRVVLREMEHGLFLGDVEHSNVVEIPANKIAEECEAVGNDGSYFTVLGSEDE